MDFDQQWNNPPREFSLLPFWFWNDELSEAELLRQIAEFDANGVYGFVIHPRVGLPRDTGWMSDKLLGFYHVAIEEAAKRDMRVLLYDEGMYPSGSSSGQLVERHPELACRCLALHDETQPLPVGAVVVQSFVDENGVRRLIVDRPVNSVIRGLHYIGDGPKEDEPPAGDLLNPRTAPAIISLVYDRFRQEFGKHFGKTILGIFTDEPNPLGRSREKGVFAGTTGVLPHLSRLIGYDVEKRLPELWQKSPQADRFREDYKLAIRLRMEDTWYAPLGKWCEANGVALCGHPDSGDEIGVQRHFQFPGQDLVWRWVLPDHPTALEGHESTQGKCSASAMVHFGRRRNSNEFAGAYGHEATFDEIRWLANWCLIRGVNLLIPHAFYYSIRGPRRDERPPQVGPHTAQWNDNGPEGFKALADHCRLWSWLNTDCKPIVDVAILTHADRCPWPAAKALLTNQRDFHYLDPTTLLEQSKVIDGRLQVADQTYHCLIIDGSAELPPAELQKLQPLIDAGHVLRYTADESPDALPLARSSVELIERINAFSPPPVRLAQADADVRLRLIDKDGQRLLMAFNESLKRGVNNEVLIPLNPHVRHALELPPGGTTVIRLNPGSGQ